MSAKELSEVKEGFLRPRMFHAARDWKDKKWRVAPVDLAGNFVSVTNAVLLDFDGWPLDTREARKMGEFLIALSDAIDERKDA